MTSNTIRYITAGLALASGILAIGDKLTSMPSLPGWLTSSWPVTLIGAGLFQHVAQILITPADSVVNKPKDGPTTGGGMIFMLAAGVSALFLSACATNTGDDDRDARGRAANQVMIEAGKVLGKVAASTLMNAAQQEMTGGKVDFGSAASQGLWSNAGSIVDSNAIANVVSAYSAGKLPATASAAAAAFKASKALPNAKAKAIASVVSTAAGAPPAK